MQLPSSFFPWVAFILKQYGVLMLRGAAVTLLVASLSTMFGFLLGLIIGIIRSIPAEHESGILRKGLLQGVNVFLNIYIEVFRGTPSMVQAMVIYYGLISVGVRMNVILASVLILSVNTGAYMAEIVRGGIISVDKGQKEAAESLGMTHVQSMKKIVLPQAIRNIVPSVCNELVINIKDTCVFNVISLNELYFMSKSAAGTYLRYFEVFFITGMLYLIMTYTVSKIMKAIEKKMDGTDETEMSKEEE